VARALDDGINDDKQSKKAFYIKAIVGFFAVLLLLALVLLNYAAISCRACTCNARYNRRAEPQSVAATVVRYQPSG
jgi:hypothetical protein